MKVENGAAILQWFHKLDNDGSGTIELHQFRSIVEKCCVRNTTAEIKELIEASGALTVRYVEFFAWLWEIDVAELKWHSERLQQIDNQSLQPTESEAESLTESMFGTDPNDPLPTLHETESEDGTPRKSHFADLPEIREEEEDGQPRATGSPVRPSRAFRTELSRELCRLEEEKSVEECGSFSQDISELPALRSTKGGAKSSKRDAAFRPSVVMAAGHQDTMLARNDDEDFILKPFDEIENQNYQELWETPSEPLQKWIATYGGVREIRQGCASKRLGGGVRLRLETKKFMRISNLTKDFHEPCVMDCKLGVRTFREKEVRKTDPRPDLYQRLEKLAPESLTDEERAAGAITKFKWMTQRDAASSTSSMGFRVDGIATQSGMRGGSKELAMLRTADEVIPMLLRVLPPRIPGDTEATRRQRTVLVQQILKQLRDLQQAMMNSAFFWSHEIIGASVLFIVSQDKAKVRLIDFAKTCKLPDGVTIDHQSPWVLGNHEDGCLLGMQELVSCWEQILTLLNEVTQTSSARSTLVVDMNCDHDREQLLKLQAVLMEHGVDTSQFGKNGAKGVEELHWELHVDRSVALEVSEKGHIRRSAEIFKSWIIAEVNGEKLVLMEDSSSGLRPFANKLSANESWQDCLRRTISEIFAIPPALQETYFNFMYETYIFSYQESLGTTQGGYPGLRTVYLVHEVDVKVQFPQAPELASMGLDHRVFTSVKSLRGNFQSGVQKWNWVPISDTSHSERGTILGYARGLRTAAADQAKVEDSDCTPIKEEDENLDEEGLRTSLPPSVSPDSSAVTGVTAPSPV